jgi:predicted nuclease of predicted toxin-antitoxin system
LFRGFFDAGDAGLFHVAYAEALCCITKDADAMVLIEARNTSG